MIDLTLKGLPNTILVNGKSFFIKTDFREWIKFGEILRNDYYKKELLYLFPECKPTEIPTKEMIEFYNNKNATPNGDGGSGERILDYILDGEFIFGSFYQSYGIDLTECDMHWHKFKALFLCLPETSKITSIMQARSYTKQNVTYEEQLERNKRAWELPYELTNKQQSELDELDYYFK